MSHIDIIIVNHNECPFPSPSANNCGYARPILYQQSHLRVVTAIGPADDLGGWGQHHHHLWWTPGRHQELSHTVQLLDTEVQGDLALAHEAAK